MARFGEFGDGVFKWNANASLVRPDLRLQPQRRRRRRGHLRRRQPIDTAPNVLADAGFGWENSRLLALPFERVRRFTDSAHGTGPVDAIYKAINRIVQRPNELIDFTINAITEGLDAVAEVTVRIRDQGAPENGSGPFKQRGPLTFSGYGVNTDTIVAAAEAYMGALNKLLSARQERIRAEEAAYAVRL